MDCYSHCSFSRRILLAGSKVFSVGFHSCLGRPLAWVELRLVLNRLLEPAEPVSFDDFPVSTLIQKEAVNMGVEVRNGIEDKTAVNYVSHRGQGQHS